MGEAWQQNWEAPDDITSYLQAGDRLPLNPFLGGRTLSLLSLIWRLPQTSPVPVELITINQHIICCVTNFWRDATHCLLSPGREPTTDPSMRTTKVLCGEPVSFTGVTYRSRVTRRQLHPQGVTPRAGNLEHSLQAVCDRLESVLSRWLVLNVFQ